jgi:hypothetical protein
MVQTEQSLAELAMRKLGVLPVGQNAPAEEVVIVRDKIEGLLAELRRRAIYFAGDVEGIEVEAFDAMGSMLANRCTSEFGISGEQLALVRDEARDAQSRLREMARGNKTPKSLRVDVALIRRRVQTW